MMFFNPQLDQQKVVIRNNTRIQCSEMPTPKAEQFLHEKGISPYQIQIQRPRWAGLLFNMIICYYMLYHYFVVFAVGEDFIEASAGACHYYLRRDDSTAIYAILPWILSSIFHVMFGHSDSVLWNHRSLSTKFVGV